MILPLSGAIPTPVIPGQEVRLHSKQDPSQATDQVFILTIVGRRGLFTNMWLQSMKNEKETKTIEADHGEQKPRKCPGEPRGAGLLPGACQGVSGVQRRYQEGNVRQRQ